MLQITSNQNAQLKLWRKLHTSKGRKKFQQLLIEGEHLVDEAISENLVVKYIIVTQAYLERHPYKFEQWQSKLVLLATQLVDQLSQTENSQGVFAVIEYPRAQIDYDQCQKILLVDAVQDPGNLGTIIRTALAASYDGILLNEGTVDLYNDKVVRSAQGALWKIPVLQVSLEEEIPKLLSQSFELLVTALNAQAKAYQEVQSHGKIALMVGNEGQGVDPQYFEKATHLIYIPMDARAESLNVAVASGILLFHF